MKELSIEEKAKAYDEALEKGKQIQNTPYTAHWDTMKEVVEYLLPELKKSDDDRMKKLCISVVKQFAAVCRKEDKYLPEVEKCIAWLEKQGEQKLPIEKLPFEMKTLSESLGFTTQKECDDYNKMVTNLIMSDDDKGEQKPEKKLLSNIVGFVKFPFKAKVNNKIVTICDGQTNMDGTFWVGFQSDSEDGYKVYKPEELEIIEQKELKKEKVDNLHNYLYGEQKPVEWSSEQSKTLQTDDVPNESSTAAPLRTGAIGFDGEPIECP